MFGDKATRKRNKLARSLERAAVPERPYIGRGPRYLVHPTITAACAPSLLAIAAALRNDPTAFSDDELKPVHWFITNGWSPFFGRDETAAMREAVRLQHGVLDPRTAVRDPAQVKQADAQAQYQSPALTRSAEATMNISNATMLIGALLAAAVITAPAALGGPAASSKTKQTATASSPCPCNVGLPGGPTAVGHTGLAAAVVTKSPCPCNVGLPGGPTAVGHAGLVAAVVTKPRGSSTGARRVPAPAP